MKTTRFLVFTLAILLICCLTLALVACGGNNDTNDSNSQPHTHVLDKTYSKDDFDHWFACSDCEEKTNLQTHSFELKANDNETWKECSVCNHIKDKIEYTKGLEYMFNEYDNSFSVIGIGTETATKIAIPPTYKGKPVTIIAAYAFENCFKLTDIVIPKSVTEINSSAFSGCTEIASINIPDSVTIIDSRAFQDCHKLTSIPIPDSVTSIGRQAFRNCYALASITIGKSVSYIGGNVFAGCKELSTIVVDENNDTYKSEGNCVLDSNGTTLIFGCKNSIIPDSVTIIGEEAFYECSALTNINIPNNVSTISDYAFNNCSKLTKITFEGTKADWNLISKGSNWDDGTGNYIIICSNGKLDKHGNAIV